jgi:hypothetical protein
VLAPPVSPPGHSPLAFANGLQFSVVLLMVVLFAQKVALVVFIGFGVVRLSLDVSFAANATNTERARRMETNTNSDPMDLLIQNLPESSLFLFS